MYLKPRKRIMATNVVPFLLNEIWNVKQMFFFGFSIILNFMSAIWTPKTLPYSYSVGHVLDDQATLLPRQFSSVLGKDHTRCRCSCCPAAAAAADVRTSTSTDLPSSEPWSRSWVQRRRTAAALWAHDTSDTAVYLHRNTVNCSSSLC